MKMLAGKPGELEDDPDDQWQSVFKEITKTLKAHGVGWVSIDFLRNGYKDEVDKPGIVCIAVTERDVIDEDDSILPIAGKAAIACKQVLEKHNIIDIDCEFRGVTTIDCTGVDLGPDQDYDAY